MVKKSFVILLTIFFVVSIILSIIYYQYKQPIYINKSMTMFDLNGVNVNHHKTVTGIQKNVTISLEIRRNLFSDDEYIGNVGLDGVEYRVLVSTDKDNLAYIVFVADTEQFWSQKTEFVLFQRDKFQAVSITHPDFILAGPAETLEEAIKKYDAVHNTP